MIIWNSGLQFRRSKTASKHAEFGRKKQAGNGPSRPHIQGSNIAEGLQSVKIFSSKAPQKSENWNSWGARGTLSSLLSQVIRKFEGGTFGEKQN